MFSPVVPFSGHAGWEFLSRTQEKQREAFASSPQIARDADYFRETIGNIKTASELVSDRRLLQVALGAFGLDGDVGNTFFVRKILEDGSLDPDALANRLSDKRYLDFTKAFGFGDFSVPRTQLSTFADEIVDAFEVRQFEIAIGDQNPDLRLALGLERDLGAIASSTNSNDGKWFAIMGTPPLRAVFETALGLPDSFGSLDIDLQLQTFSDRAISQLGTDDVAKLAEVGNLAELTRLFIGRSEIKNLGSTLTSGSAAITLMQGSVEFQRSLRP